MYKKTLYILLIAYNIALPIAAQDCVISGCNSEICSDFQEPQMGICEWKPEYACYHQYGVCEKDASGICSWVQTPELLECIAKLQQELSGSHY